MNWQPIETAPKDGTRIILANNKTKSAGDEHSYALTSARWKTTYSRPKGYWFGATNQRHTHWLAMDALPPLPVQS